MGVFDVFRFVWRFNRILLIIGSFILPLFQSSSFSSYLWTWIPHLFHTISNSSSWNPINFVCNMGIFSDAKTSFLRLAVYLLSYSAVDTLQCWTSEKSIFRSLPTVLTILPMAFLVPNTFLGHVETLIIYRMFPFPLVASPTTPLSTPLTTYSSHMHLCISFSESLAYFLICEVVVWMKLSVIFDAKMLERIHHDKWAYGYMGFGLTLFGASSYAIWSALAYSWDEMSWWIISVMGLFLLLILAVYYLTTVIGSPPTPSIMFVALPWLFAAIVLCDASGVYVTCSITTQQSNACPFMGDFILNLCICLFLHLQLPSANEWCWEILSPFNVLRWISIAFLFRGRA
jgi:hypothetical protein